MRTKEFLMAKFGLFGIALGTVALLIALIGFFEGPFTPPPASPSLKDTAKESLINMGTEIAAKIRRGSDKVQTPQPAQPEYEPFNIDRLLAVIVLTLGVFALLLGILGFARREYYRVPMSAAAIGISAILFQYFAIYIFGVLLIFFAILAIGNALDSF